MCEVIWVWMSCLFSFLFCHDRVFETRRHGHGPEDEVHVDCVQSMQGIGYTSRVQ